MGRNHALRRVSGAVLHATCCVAFTEIPDWVTTETDLEQFLYDKKQHGVRVIRRHTGSPAKVSGDEPLATDVDMLVQEEVEDEVPKKHKKSKKKGVRKKKAKHKTKKMRTVLKNTYKNQQK